MDAFLRHITEEVGDRKASELSAQEITRARMAALTSLGLSSSAVEGAFVHFPAPNGADGADRANTTSSSPPPHPPGYKLVYSHECEYLGCADDECPLCRLNPHKECISPFDSRYCVSSKSRAKCSAAIVVNLVDSRTGKHIENLPCSLRGRAIVVDSELYARTNSVEASMVTCTTKDEPLLRRLTDKMKGVLCEALELVFRSSGGRTWAEIPPFTFMASSESVLEGKNNLFSMCCVVDGISPDNELRHTAEQGGTQPVVDTPHPKDVAPAVSTPFIVVSRRMKKASKSSIPFASDPLAKLKHMGRTAVKKLESLGTANVPGLPKWLSKVENVGQLKTLAQRSKTDENLRNALLNVLKIPEAKWDEVCEQASRCISQKDNRVRIWCPANLARDKMRMGFLFACDCGCPDLSMPIGIFGLDPPGPGSAQAGTAHKSHTQTFLISGVGELAYKINLDDLRLVEYIKAQREAYRTAWMEPGHPDWQIADLETHCFLKTKERYVMFRSVLNSSSVFQGLSSGVGLPSGSHTADPDQVPVSAFAQLGALGWNETVLTNVGSGATQGAPSSSLDMCPPMALVRPGSAGIGSVSTLLDEQARPGHRGELTTGRRVGEMSKGGDDGSTGTNSGSRPGSLDSAMPSGLLNCPMWQSDDLDKIIARQLGVDHLLTVDETHRKYSISNGKQVRLTVDEGATDRSGARPEKRPRRKQESQDLGRSL